MSIHDRDSWHLSPGAAKRSRENIFDFTGYPQDYWVRPEDLDWWLERAPTLKFRFASSMTSTPHSYVIRGKTLKDAEYRRAYGVINTFGQPGKFWERMNLYLKNGTDHWWNMTGHEHFSMVLNYSWDGKDYGVQDAPSTRTAYWSDYDHIGCYFDDVHAETHQKEQVELWKLCDRLLQSGKPTCLDLGAGTGGTLDARIAGSTDTTAVDVSQGMLNALVFKYPRIKTVVPASVEEYLSWQTGTTHDLVIASFGAASHLSPEAIDLLPSIAKRAVVLSFYSSGYRPHYLHLMQREIDDDDARAVALDYARGQFETHGNYQVISLKGEA